jgi:hypothetical protein
VLKVETSLVTVPVSVLDRQGRFISNLKQDDFHIFENGVEQTVAYFEPAEKPFTVALVWTHPLQPTFISMKFAQLRWISLNSCGRRIEF